MHHRYANLGVGANPRSHTGPDWHTCGNPNSYAQPHSPRFTYADTHRHSRANANTLARVQLCCTANSPADGGKIISGYARANDYSDSRRP